MKKIPFLNLKPMHDSIKDQLLVEFKEVVDKNSFILGNKLKEFETAYAEFNGVKYSVGVSNGLDALFLSLKALGIGPGDEVIVPSNTYIATALAVSYTGAMPVFVEPDIHSYTLDPFKVEKAISRKTKVIIPVHLYGQACDMNIIIQIAERYSLYIVEDNAQAHGSEFCGKLTGSFGTVNGTSFYPGKNLGALGDGGAVTTNHFEIYKILKKLRNYGSGIKYYHEIIGYNMRLDELQAAFLTVKLNHLRKWIAERQSIASLYLQYLYGVGDLILPATISGATHVYHLFVIRTSYRDKLVHYLNEIGINTLIHYPIPIHLQKAYSDLGLRNGTFPISEEIAATCLSLPLWPGMQLSEVELVSSAIIDFFKKVR